MILKCTIQLEKYTYNTIKVMWAKSTYNKSSIVKFITSIIAYANLLDHKIYAGKKKEKKKQKLHDQSYLTVKVAYTLLLFFIIFGNFTLKL